MTAEIIVMNREAVAMAADSAVTVGSKIYQTANKLFTLSKVYPVGIMISNAADFMGVPWETIVKMFREKTLRNKQPNAIQDYAVSFLSFLGSPELCSKEQQEARIGLIVQDHLAKVLEVARRDWIMELLSEGKCTATKKNALVRRALESYRDFLTGRKDYQFKAFNQAKLVRRHKKTLDTAIDDTVGELALTNSSRAIAYECAKLAILKAIGSGLSSTIAIAGFGGNEIFPATLIIELDGVIGDEFKVISWQEKKISAQGTTSCVIPLAQSEMVYRFMEGIDDTYQRRIDNYFRDFCDSLGMTDAQANPVLQKFKENMAQFRKDTYSDPILRTLINLPKHDMARMAEALVSLTSLKRRVSEELETVADPIDIAIVSKGDGFVWIKRKHYFSPELNPHFATQYLRDR